MEISILDNEIAKGDYELAKKIPIEMSDSDKTAYRNDWSTYWEQNTHLENNRGQAYSLILGQNTQLLHDNMKQYTAWHATRSSYKPLTLIQLIEKMTFSQTEYQY